MKWLGAGLLGLLLTGTAAHALSCQPVPLDERVQEIMRTQHNPKSLFLTSPALGLGQLSKPVDPRCEGTDWAGSTTCDALQGFSGTLYTTHGIDEVTDTPVHGTFYKSALHADDVHPYAFWRPWTDAPMLIAFERPVSGPLRFTHIDSCTNGIIRPATPELRRALTACHTRRTCPEPALAYLRSLLHFVF